MNVTDADYQKRQIVKTPRGYIHYSQPPESATAEDNTPPDAMYSRFSRADRVKLARIIDQRRKDGASVGAIYDDLLENGELTDRYGRQVAMDTFKHFCRNRNQLLRNTDTLQDNCEILLDILRKHDGFIRCRLWELWMIIEPSYDGNQKERKSKGSLASSVAKELERQGIITVDTPQVYHEPSIFKLI